MHADRYTAWMLTYNIMQQKRSCTWCIHRFLFVWSLIQSMRVCVYSPCANNVLSRLIFSGRLLCSEKTFIMSIRYVIKRQYFTAFLFFTNQDQLLANLFWNKIKIQIRKGTLAQLYVLRYTYSVKQKEEEEEDSLIFITKIFFRQYAILCKQCESSMCD